ncbi:12634_t:CDS:2, partial [Dentiscutata erythropus]
MSVSVQVTVYVPPIRIGGVLGQLVHGLCGLGALYGLCGLGALYGLCGLGCLYGLCGLWKPSTTMDNVKRQEKRMIKAKFR